MLRTRIIASALVSLFVVLSLISVRTARSDDADRARFDHRSQAIDVDFGDWPNYFYAGAGGDGEVFAVLAVDPFGGPPSQTILSPVLRYSRIGFSLLPWMLSLGNETYALPALAIVGTISLAGLGFMARYWNDILGWRSWLLLGNPAVFLGFLGDTAEPLAVLLLALTLTSGSLWLAGLLGSVRPTYISGLFGRWRPLLIGLVVAGAVRGIASYLFPDAGIGIAGSVSWPLHGYLQFPSLGAGMILVACLATLIQGVRKRDPGWVIAGCSVLCLGPLVLENPVNAFRAAGLLPVLWAFGPRYRLLESRSWFPGLA